MKSLLIPTLLLVAGCGKNTPCPDPELRAKHQGDICTMEYSPVCGCDGKNYGNECSARREGVRVVKQGEC